MKGIAREGDCDQMRNGPSMKDLPVSPWIRAVAASTTVALFMQLLAVPLRASESSPAAAQVAPARATAENVQVAFNRGVVTIAYDLVSPEGQSTFDVTLEVSTNGGQTYDVDPRSMSGDIGPSVSTGRSKRVVWEASKDVENLQADQFRFRVVIRITTGSDVAAVPPPSAPQTQPGVTPPASTPGMLPGRAPRRSTGSKLFWPGVGASGAGIALAALAAAGPQRKRTDFPTYYELTPNTPVVAGGVSLAAAGVLMILLGRRGAHRVAAVEPIPGGVMLSRSMTF